MYIAYFAVLMGYMIASSGVLAVPTGKTLYFKNLCDRAIDVNQAFPADPGETVGTVGPTMILKANGGSGNVEMTAHQSGGVSTKFHYHGESHSNGIVQLEHTLVTDPKFAGLFWDASFVDANGLGPFKDVNVTFTPSDKNCPPIFCAAGEVCAAGYQYPEDVKTRFCSLNTESIEVVFCANPDAVTAPAWAPIKATKTAKTAKSTKFSKRPKPTKSTKPVPKHFAHHA